MRTVLFPEVPTQEWDAVCARSQDAWLFHRAAWVDIEARFFVRQNHSFAVRTDDRVIAIQPLYLSECGLGAWSERLVNSGIHRHTGLALVPDLDAADARAARRVAMRRIFETAHALDADRVQLNSHNLAPVRSSGSRCEIPFWVEDYGFQLGLAFGPMGMSPAPGMTTCCADQVVDLAAEEQTMFDALDDSCRRAVRKAKSFAIEFEAGVGSDCVGEYYSLAKMAAIRTGELLPPVTYFQDIWQRFFPSGQCTVLFARHADRRVAALWLLLYKNAASFLAGVYDPQYLPMRVNDFIHWSAMLWARNAGCTLYRLGPSFPELPAHWPIARVSRFKTKFGGRPVTVVQGSTFLHPERYHGIAMANVERLCHLGTDSGRADGRSHKVLP